MKEQDWLLRKVQEHYDGMHWDEASGGWVDRYGTPIKTRPWSEIRRTLTPEAEARVTAIRRSMEHR